MPVAKPLRVAVCPIQKTSLYQQLLHGALRAEGISVVECPGIDAVLRRRRRIDVVHLHWLEYLVGSNDAERLKPLRMSLRAAWLLVRLVILRACDIRLVWTVHNLQPHEARHPRIDRLLARAVAFLADDVIVHSRYAAGLVEAKLGRSAVVVAPHGHFIDVYDRSGRARDDIRSDLGIPPGATTFLIFGQVRRYKRIESLVNVFRSLPGADLRLLVAGQPRPETLGAEIERAAQHDPRIVFRWGYIPDSEVADLHHAADVAVLPYGDVFSSAALLLALSLELPVIAPADTTATEIAGAPAILGYWPGGLRDALEQAAADPPDAGTAALDAAERQSWTLAARIHAEVYGGTFEPEDSP